MIVVVMVRTLAFLIVRRLRGLAGLGPGPGSARDEPGLLTGAAGTALALADHGQLPTPTAPARWDSLLLLS